MPFNGTGTFQRVRNWVADAAAGIKVRADYHDAEDDGFAAGLTNCITKDGQTVVTQNIPFNNKRITGLQDPVNPQDVATKAYADTKLDSTRDKDKLCQSGAIMDYATQAAPEGWLVCDGQEVSRTTYADLFTAIGTAWGAGNSTTTFNVPNFQSRYRRHRDGGSYAGGIGTMQAPCNLTHTHNVNGGTGYVSNDHTHHIDFGSQGCGSTLDHTHGGVPGDSALTTGGYVYIGTGSAAGYADFANRVRTSGHGGNLDHTHRILGDTGGISANHSHAFNVNSGGGTADGNETRPYSATVLTCIKT